MEEKHIQISQPGKRQAPSPGKRVAAPEQPPKVSKTPRAPRPGGQTRAVTTRVLWILYGILVAISAVIVAGFLLFQLLVKPPEQTPVPTDGSLGAVQRDRDRRSGSFLHPCRTQTRTPSPILVFEVNAGWLFLQLTLSK